MMKRYLAIMDLMKKFDAEDEMVLEDLRNRCVKELGIPFVVGYYYKMDRENFPSWIGRTTKKAINRLIHIRK